MFNQLIIKWIIGAVGAALISLGLYAGYSHIKQIGYKEATAEYEERIKEYNTKLEAHILNLEHLSSDIATENQVYIERVNKDIKGILLTVKGITPYVIVDGKCMPSKDFTDAYNKVIGKANE
jgi:hypothetical protein